MHCKHLKIRSKKGNKYCYCALLKKNVDNYCSCEHKEYKQYNKLSTKNVYKFNKNKKIINLENNRFSIFTKDLEHCIVCDNKKDNLHEIIYGKNRLNSMKYGFVIPLCLNHHTGDRGIHFNNELNMYYRKKCQEYFENNIGDRLDFIRIFGKSYL